MADFGPRWPTDVARFCERLAERLAARGSEHPAAAALALAVRGRRGVTTDELAAELGLDPAELHAIEAGRVPAGELPPELVSAADALGDPPVARLLRP